MIHPFNVLRHVRQWERAPRDPITVGTTVGTWILGASGAAAAGSIVTYAVGFLVTTAITSSLLRALSKNQQAGNGGTLVNTRQAAATQEYVYGQIRKGGIITFLKTTGSKNSVLHMIVSLAGHEVEEIGNIYVNDQVVTLDSNGYVTGDRWKSKIRVLKHLGNQTSWTTNFANAPTNLQSTISTECELSSEFVGKGIAYMYVRMEYNKDVFSGGIPNITAVVKGKKVYDPRTSTTAYSNNAALCLRDYIVDVRGLADSSVNDTYFSSAADDCDDLIAKKDGIETQARYTVDGVINAEVSVGDTIADMLEASNGVMFYGGGQWRLKVGKWSSSVESFTLDDLRSGISLSTRVSRRDNYNSVTGKFVNAATDWVEASFPAVTSAEFLAEDGGIENALDISLQMVTDHVRAQRIAKQRLFRGREQMSISAEFGLKAMNVEVGDIISLTVDNYGWTNKKFEVIAWKLIIDNGVRVSLGLRETSAAAFSWNAEEITLISNNTTLPEYTFVPDIGIAVSTELYEYYEKVSNVATLELTADDPEFVDYVQVQFKKSSASVWRSAGQGDIGTFEIYDLPDDDYDFRARAINGFGYKGEWATLSNYTVNGLSQPPANVTNFTAEINHDTINFSWDAVADLDLSYYVIRWTSSTTSTIWADTTSMVVKVARPSTHATVPAKKGTYMIKAVDKTGIRSRVAARVVVRQADLVPRTVHTTLTENPTFSGTKTNTTVVSGALRLNAATSGSYQFSNYIDRGSVTSSWVHIDVTPIRYSTTTSFDGLTGLLDLLPGLWDDLNAAGNEYDDTDVIPYISTTDDDPAGTPTWSSWARFRAGSYYCRAMRFKVESTSQDTSTTPSILELSATARY